MKKFAKIAACIAAISAMLINYTAFAAPTATPAATAEPEALIDSEATLDPQSTVDSQATFDPESTFDPEATAESQTTTDPTETVDSAETTEPSSSPAPAVSAAPAGPTANTLDFTVHMADKKYVVASFIKVEVYDKTGTLVGTDREWIGGITKTVDLHYDVP